MKIFLISNNSKKIGALELMLTRYGESITVKHFDDFSIKEALEHDLIVLSGGSNLTIHKNRDILANELKLIKESTRPIIGVCLGFELLIDAYHGDLLYDPEKIQGLTQIEARENHPIFKRQKNFLFTNHISTTQEKHPVNSLYLLIQFTGLK